MEFGSRNSIWDDTINIFNQRLSWKEKKANDFEWAKKCADCKRNIEKICHTH